MAVVTAAPTQLAIRHLILGSSATPPLRGDTPRSDVASSSAASASATSLASPREAAETSVLLDSKTVRIKNIVTTIFLSIGALSTASIIGYSIIGYSIIALPTSIFIPISIVIAVCTSYGIYLLRIPIPISMVPNAPPIGIINKSGADCWAGSLMHLIAISPKFRNYLMRQYQFSWIPTLSEPLLIPITHCLFQYFKDQQVRKQISSAKTKDQTEERKISSAKTSDIRQPLAVLSRRAGGQIGISPSPRVQCDIAEGATLIVSSSRTQDANGFAQDICSEPCRTITTYQSVLYKPLERQGPNNFKYTSPLLSTGTSLLGLPIQEGMPSSLLDLLRASLKSDQETRDNIAPPLELQAIIGQRVTAQVTQQIIYQQAPSEWMFYVQRFGRKKISTVPSIQVSAFSQRLNRFMYVFEKRFPERSKGLNKTSLESSLPPEVLSAALTTKGIQVTSRDFDRKITTEIEVPATFKLETIESQPPGQYILDSFVIHTGDQLDRGHYISYIRQEDDENHRVQWYECNDAEVTPISLDSALLSAKSAYMLHYKKDDNPFAAVPAPAAVASAASFLKNRFSPHNLLAIFAPATTADSSSAVDPSKSIQGGNPRWFQRGSRVGIRDADLPSHDAPEDSLESSSFTAENVGWNDSSEDL